MAFTPQAVNAFSPEPFEYAYSMGDGPNGCFVVTTIVKNQTYAGIIELGLTSWSMPADLLQFDMYTSPDAWHGVNVKLTALGFEGSGGSGGAGAAEPHLGPDVVKGRRTGVANLGECVRASSARQRKSHGAV